VDRHRIKTRTDNLSAVAERSVAAFFFLVSAILDATTERIFDASGKGILASL
jgi:hypothetical protein